MRCGTHGWQPPTPSSGGRRGVALIAVLSVLTVLALLAMAFAVLTGIEQGSSATSFYGLDAMALAESGLEHAKVLLWCDAVGDTTHADSPQDLWYTISTRHSRGVPDVDVDLVGNNGPRRDGADAAWIPVQDAQGRLVGRYALVIQDECGKLHLNAACLGPNDRPNEGLSPRELQLGDGSSRGLPFSAAALQRLVAYKYGPNGVPGTRGDDNHNNALLMADGLDNNANGIVDELDEGINELEEYVPAAPYGDDRVLTSLQEAWHVLAPRQPATPERLAMLRQFATLHSRETSLRWDRAKQGWEPRLNINIAAARDVVRTLGQANKEYVFEGDQRTLRRIGTAIVDYRDENAVLSTAGSEYGVEAVCFNEVLANEGSRIRQTYYVQNFRSDDIRVHSLAYLYGDYNYRENEPLQGDRLNDIRRREQGNNYTAWGINFSRVQRVGSELRIELGDAPAKQASGYFNSVSDFKQVLRRRGVGMLGNRIRWPDNIWANGFLTVFTFDGGNVKRTAEKTFRITRSTERELYLDTSTMTAQDFHYFTSVYFYAQLRSWTFEKAYYAEHPRVSNWFMCGGLQRDKYYRVYLQETNLETPTGDARGGMHLSEYVDADGVVSRSSEQRMHRLRYNYKDGVAQRADRAGYIDVFVTSARDCSPMRRNRINAIYFARPDIIELMNISARPVSLRGWSLVANTGALSYELGVIDRATMYSREDNGRIVDRNPTIRPNEYFYLCNNIEIFDRDYGRNKNGVWGSSNDEQMPVYEINDDSWGVRFLIRNIRETGGRDGQQGWSYLTCDSESWRPGQFKNEVAEFQTTRRSPRGMSTSPDGVRALIYDNSRNTLVFESLLLKKYSDVREGDHVMIVGLPRVGGFLSMTLKNEYGQIAARVLEYGDPQREAGRDEDQWLNWSAEKSNPTREEWVMTSSPTFGGTVREARNRAAVLAAGRSAHIKNGPFGSIGELGRARALAVWEQANDARRTPALSKMLQGAAEYCDVNGLRLDAEEPDAHIQGWLPAFGEASISDTRGLADLKAAWEVNLWTNQSVRLLTGKHRGETFRVDGNSKTHLRISSRSVPSRATFYVKSGDRYAVGPGYLSAMYYSRREHEPGIWEWKNKRIPPGTYQLYLTGLNDAIRTTEFLEENNNAKLDVYLYNFVSNTYDLLGSDRQYDKSDTVYVGVVQPAHISGTGGLRLQLVPKQLHARDARGFAWFDYAYLTPVPVEGRINLNTASERVLMALGDISPQLARDLARGIDNGGNARLKPYCTIGDILNVRGMTPELFGKLTNLVTVRSDQYNVYVIAQRLHDVDSDGRFNPDAGDRVVSQVRLRALLNRSGLTSGDAVEPTLQVHDRQRF
jgi:hypothetical protein